MSELDLTEAERAVRLELARVIEGGIAVDLGEYATRAALPHILDALTAKALNGCDDRGCEQVAPHLIADWLREQAKEARGLSV